jgi:uncharacterized protein (UPF0276 family)
MSQLPHRTITGAGIGLRSVHYQEILDTRPAVNWFEVLTENYIGDGGMPLYHLDQISARYPVTLHGVGMSLGSSDPLNFAYLERLRALLERLEPVYVSDHLAWVSVGGRYLHDLIPIPYTGEALTHVAERVRTVQDFLGRRLLIENPAAYLSFQHSEMTEWEFLAQLVELTDCELLLDVNNVHVSAVNTGFDALEYLRAVPPEQVREIHLAGYEVKPSYLFDTHGHRVHPPVWVLYGEALKLFGPVPTLIEWDTDIPALSVLMDEAQKAQDRIDQVKVAA